MEEGCYGLGLENLTSLDKSKKGIVSQKGAFTIVQIPSVGIKNDYLVEKETFGCADIVVTGFHMKFLTKWKFRLLKWLAMRL